MAREIARFVHPELPDGELFFLEEEFLGLKRNPFHRIEPQVSQTGRVSLVYVGQNRSIFTVEMSMFFRDTVERLDLLRVVQEQTGGQEPFILYPFWFHDHATNYEVLWTNVAEFFEQHAHGRIEGCWLQTAIFEEVVTGVCIVPS